jgi:hypothetical protein
MWVWGSHVSTRWASQHVRSAVSDSPSAKGSYTYSLRATSAHPATSVSIELAPQLLLIPVRLRLSVVVLPQIQVSSPHPHSSQATNE